MYVQAALGNDRFAHWLDQFKYDIMNSEKYRNIDREEAGAISLGYRISLTRSEQERDHIVSKKGAYVLHMLRNLLLDLETFSEGSFTDMMAELYSRFQDTTLTTLRFRELTEKYTGMDMGWFFDQWVYGSDIPTYDFSFKLERGEQGNYNALCRVEQSDVSENFRMFVPLEVEFKSGAKHYFRLLIDKPLYEFSLPPLAEKPKHIRFNPFNSVLANVNQ
jgi:hypothetical protein